MSRDFKTPRSLNEYIGQERAKEVLQVLAEAAKVEKRLIPNILLVGSGGLGKTTLANLLLKKYKIKYWEHNAASLNLLKSLYFKDSDFFFSTGTYLIDEIHNIPIQFSDLLHRQIDAGEISIIGTTTSPGKLSGPFRSRFYSVYLIPYTASDLEQIVTNLIKRRKYFTVTDEAIKEIAKRSRFTARTAVQYTSFIFDLASTNKHRIIDEQLVEEAFIKLGVDNQGLTEVDHKYLDIIPDDRPVGIQYISSKLGMDSESIEEEIEPFLMRAGFIDRSNKGRYRLDTLEKQLAESISMTASQRILRTKQMEG